MVLPISVPRLSPKASTSSRRTLLRSTSASASATLAEALRANPFRLGSTETLAIPEPEPEDETQELNDALVVLAELFPDVKVEVIRELVIRFNGSSRLEISAEQLYKHKAEYAKGRLNFPPRQLGEEIPVVELFRKKAYAVAVKNALGLEFRNLNKSAIEAVLAEVNSSYTRARPVLQGLVNKSWRYTISSFFRKKKPQDDFPSCLFEFRKVAPRQGQLIPTGSEELDAELTEMFLRTPPSSSIPENTEADFEYAQTVNLKEAKEAGALFECQCCYNDITFENVAMCQSSMHVICFDCIRRTLQEALFGQGWAKSVDPTRGTLRCLAPLANDCDGHLPQELVKRAVLADRAGSSTWTKYEDRLTNEALQKSQLKVVTCPFCPYAEADHAYDVPSARKLRWRIRRTNVVTCLLILLTFLNLLPIIITLFLLPFLLVITKYRASDLFYTAIGNLALRHHRPARFRCQNPACKRPSCLKCQKAWHDPHICHEPLLLSLRTTVEAARTAAVKRTCPRCGTSFVKASGCNKLTCTCGYAMCYLCRKDIGGGGGSGEGYRHFCEHFRPNPGKMCTECQKCDLYRAEDEDIVVRKAGEEAERNWRVQEGLVGVQGLENAVNNGTGEEGGWWGCCTVVFTGDWTIEGCVQGIVERIVVLEEPV